MRGSRESDGSAYSCGMELPDRPFRFDELAELGLTPHQLRALTAEGRVRRVLRGVYADAALADDTRMRARAAALVVAPTAVICDRSAAWLHGVDVFEPGQKVGPPDLELVTPCAAARVRRRGTSAARRNFRDQDVMTIEGVRVTTPVRTACDLGRLRGRMGAFAALCMLGRQQGFGAAAVQAALPHMKGLRGVVQLRELAACMTTRCESPSEAWTLLAILDAGLPRPEAQVEIMLEGYGPVRLDFAYRLVKIAIEYDGQQHHSMPEDRERDATRRAALRAAGWIVIVMRKNDFVGEALDRWLGEVRGALAEVARPQARVYSRAASSVTRHRR